MPPRYKTPARTPAEARQRTGFRNWLAIYEMWSLTWQNEAEHETRYFRQELSDYREANPPPRLKDYMQQTKGQPR